MRVARRVTESLQAEEQELLQELDKLERKENAAAADLEAQRPVRAQARLLPSTPPSPETPDDANEAEPVFHEF